MEVETIQIITTFINTIGFPIAMCVFLMRRQERESENHKAEVEKMTEALNNNTIMLTKLCERLGGDES